MVRSARTPRSRTQVRARVRSRLRSWRFRARSRIHRRNRYRMRKITKGVHSFSRYETKAISIARSIQLIGGAGATTFTTEQLVPFQLANLVNADDFKNLYQAYKIDRVDIEMTWSNEDVVQSSVSTTNPAIGTNAISQVYDPLNAITCYYFRDYDGAPRLIPDEDGFRERQNVKKISMKKGKQYKFSLSPATRSVQWATPPSLPGGNPTFSTGRAFGRWINMEMNNTAGVETDGTIVPHYGFQVGFAHPNPGAQPSGPRFGTVSVSCRYHFTCKGVS